MVLCHWIVNHTASRMHVTLLASLPVRAMPDMAALLVSRRLRLVPS